MNVAQHHTRADTSLVRRVWRAWPVWSTWAALTWSAAYAVAGLYWWTGGPGFPFGDGDPSLEDKGRLLAGATAETAGPVIVGLGAIGVVVAALMLRRVRRLWPLLVAYGAGIAIFLTLVLPESRAITVMPPLGLLFLLRPPDLSTLNFAVLMVGGFMWAGATLAYWRSTRRACLNCGRTSVEVTPETERKIARWGRMATYSAIVAPWGYALVRLAWAMDIPVGTSQGFIDQINSANPGNGTRVMEVTLAGMAIGGSILTIGLLRPWGERFPRWMVGLAGRPVPLAFPIGFAGLTAANLTAFGTSMLRGIGGFFADGMIVSFDDDLVFQMDPLWELPPVAVTVWGVSLALATVAYYRRRRPQCRYRDTHPLNH